MFTLNSKGTLFTIDHPVTMGIINATPDSFYGGSRAATIEAALNKAGNMIQEGASILDIGGQSTRPDSEIVDVKEELTRVIPVIEAVKKAFPSTLISVDTYYPEVAANAIAAGADMVNDISGGRYFKDMLPTVAQLKVPYICMHSSGTLETMHEKLPYENITNALMEYFIERIDACQQAGILDIIIDPGFGFGKTIEHNFELLRRMGELKTVLQLPVLAGISRKSMIYKTLGSTASEALNGTSALHMVALQQGADILRVHDVKEAVEVRTLFRTLYPE